MDTVLLFFSLFAHTDMGLLLPGNSCLRGYRGAAEYVVQRSTGLANELEMKPKQLLDGLPSGPRRKQILFK